MSLTPHAIAAIALTIGSLALMSRDAFRLEYSCVAILIVMVTGFEVFPVPVENGLRGAQFLAAFGNEALITICLLLVLAKGVEASGTLRRVGRLLTRLWFFNRSLGFLVTLFLAAFVSAFANNTPIVIMLLPILVGVANRIDIPPSQMLMPVGFASIIGGMSTTIGTSTNLLVVSIAADLGLPRLQMFDFLLPAAIAGSVGILYLWQVLPRLLPQRKTPLEQAATRRYDSFLTIAEGGPLSGLTLSQAMRTLGEHVRIHRVLRSGALELVRLPTLVLQPGDRLQIRGAPEHLHTAHDAAGSGVSENAIQRTEDERLVEIVVTADSPLQGKRLSELQPGTLRELYPIGWYRPAARVSGKLDRFTDPILRTGDVLLMQGPRQDIQKLMESTRILIISRAIHLPRLTKAPLSVAIMAGVVVIAAVGILPIIASALCGVGLMLLTRCLTWNEAWSAVDTRLVLVIAASLALGTALVGTGAAEFIAHGFVILIQNLPPPLVLSALLLVTALLTEIVTNNAIAVIATPIAISVASELGLPPIPFVLAILFGANMSYLTPIGYQTNLLVMSAGGYRFSDFFRGGLPLQLLLWAILSVALPAIYL